MLRTTAVLLSACVLGHATPAPWTHAPPTQSPPTPIPGVPFTPAPLTPTPTQAPPTPTPTQSPPTPTPTQSPPTLTPTQAPATPTPAPYWPSDCWRANTDLGEAQNSWTTLVHPATGATYQANKDQCWRFGCDDTWVGTWEKFDTELYYDFVTIFAFDKSSNSWNQIMRRSGGSTQPVEPVEGPVVVRFTSDHIVQRGGFSLLAECGTAPRTPAPSTLSPTPAPSTQSPPTQAPPTQSPPTSTPPTNAPPTQSPPTSTPPTNAPPTPSPPTEAPPAQ